MFKVIGIRHLFDKTFGLDTFMEPISEEKLRECLSYDLGPNKDHVFKWLDSKPNPGAYCVWYSQILIFRCE